MSKVKNQPRKQKSGQQKPVAAAPGSHAAQGAHDRQPHQKAAVHEEKAHAGDAMMMSSVPDDGMRMPSHKKGKRYGHN